MNDPKPDPLPPNDSGMPQEPVKSETPFSLPVHPGDADDRMVEDDGSDWPDAVREFWQAAYQATPRTYVTYALVGINIAVFALMLTQGMNIMQPTNEILLNWGANFAPLTLQGQPWRLLTSMFLHIGIIHLALNMYVLWDVGQVVERLFGNVGFLLLYLFSGLIGSLASVAWNSSVISAGASGAVFGVYGALLGLVLLHRHAIPMEIVVPLRNSGFMFLVYNVGFGLVYAGIDQAAHVGGLIGGFVAGMLLGQPLTADLQKRRLVRNMIFGLGSAVIVGVLAMLLQGRVSDFQNAMQHFAKVEERAIGIVNDATNRAQAGQLTDAELADILEKQVLPEWSEATKRLQNLDRLSAKEKEFAQLYLELAKNRQEGWELVIEGVRTNNPEKFMQAQFKQKAAEAAILRVKGLKGR